LTNFINNLPWNRIKSDFVKDLELKEFDKMKAFFENQITQLHESSQLREKKLMEIIEKLNSDQKEWAQEQKRLHNEIIALKNRPSSGCLLL